MPSSVENSTTRSLIERSGSGTDATLGWIQGVTEPVADEVDAQDDEDDHEAREGDEPPLLDARVLAVVQQGAEGGRRWLDPKAEEGQSRLEEDRDTDGQRCGDHDRPDRVREHVADHDAEVARPCSPGRLDVLLLTQRQEAAPDDAGDAGPDQGR